MMRANKALKEANYEEITLFGNLLAVIVEVFGIAFPQLSSMTMDTLFK